MSGEPSKGRGPALIVCLLGGLIAFALAAAAPSPALAAQDAASVEELVTSSDAFLAAHPEFRALSAQEVLAAQGVALETGERLRLLPHVHDTDGFFAAVMERAKGA